MIINRKYSWIKQKPDPRDYNFKKLSAIKNFQLALPKVINNRKWCSEVADQGQLGSCTANAWAGLLQYNEIKNGRGGSLYSDLSRLFIYYNERVIENTISQDSGAELRDGAKAIATKGVCIESEWPYKINSFKRKPINKCYIDALPNVIHSYYSLDGKTSTETLNNLKTCLANGQCFVFGFTVYDSFESQTVADTGIVPMPNLQTENVLGGHAVMAIGYDDNKKTVLVRNSWGKNWGLKGTLGGYFTMPYNYITDSNLASDFWTVVKDI